MRGSPVYAKLQARKATVFVHPTTPCNSQVCNHSDLTPQRKRDSIPLSDIYIIGIMEYFFDSARTFVDILLSGTAAAHPDVTFIVPHCGNALPSVLDRALLTSSPELRHFQTRPMHALTAPVVKEMFTKQFYFDLSGNPMSNQIHHMLRWVKSDRFLYGSDVPFTRTNTLGRKDKLNSAMSASWPPRSPAADRVNCPRPLSLPFNHLLMPLTHVGSHAVCSICGALTYTRQESVMSLDEVAAL
ncbi:hypothetical protein BDZ89DRAFT_388466 [Hymenopellis radicata]|nr:hypothetical protein BDZ89DRAFT_388466 [Hymenopellis radicata]